MCHLNSSATASLKGDATVHAKELGALREKLYATFGSRRDALFELTDAILTASTDDLGNFVR